MKNIIVITALVTMLFFSLFITTISVRSYQSEDLEVYLFFTWMEEDGSWHEWINVTGNYYSDIRLKINQTIKCRIETISRIKGHFSFWLYEPGNVDTFEVVEGNKQEVGYNYLIVNPEEEDTIYNPQHHPLFNPNEQIVDTWVLRTTDRWHGGRAPINILWDMSPSATKKDDMGEWIYPDDISREQTMVNPYIENKQWKGPSYTPDNNNGDGDSNGNGNNNNADTSTPGFEVILLITSLFAVILLLKKWKS